MNTIDNGILSVSAEDFGAQLASIRCGGHEYLWQRDPAFWKDSAPNLFPYIARLTEGKYFAEGKQYEMKIHGFVKYTDLKLTEKTETSMTFELTDSEETRKQYPWAFLYRIRYALDGKKLSVNVSVTNRDERKMYFGEGGHPGFAVPLTPGLSYEDYYAALPEAEDPVRIGFSEDCFRNGADAPYLLDEKKRIPLSHGLFTQDAIVLKNAGHCAVIGSDADPAKLKLTWTHPFLGIWSKPFAEAPYVCIEPWGALPSRKGRIEAFETQEDLICLAPGETYESEWTVEVIS